MVIFRVEKNVFVKENKKFNPLLLHIYERVTLVYVFLWILFSLTIVSLSLIHYLLSLIHYNRLNLELKKKK